MKLLLSRDGEPSLLSLAAALVNNTHLKVLDLSESGRDITNEGWEALFNALQSNQCVLQELNLGDNLFGDQEVTYLANSLSNNSLLRHLSLRHLYYSGNRPPVTPSGWRAFSAVLQNPNSALETVDLQCNSINDDALVSFANSLVHNSKVKELFLHQNRITLAGWGALSNVLCNRASITATFNSNHTLQRVLEPGNDARAESRFPSDVRTSLQLARENTKIEAARRKILKVHFSGDLSIQPFIHMNLKALPNAIAWMARDEHGSSLLYKFVRNTTLFVGIGRASQSEGEPKSKRQKM